MKAHLVGHPDGERILVLADIRTGPDGVRLLNGAGKEVVTVPARWVESITPGEVERLRASGVEVVSLEDFPEAGDNDRGWDRMVLSADIDHEAAMVVEPEDGGAEVGAYELRAAMLAVFGPLVAGIDRARKGERLRVVGLRAVAMVCVLRPELALPGASLVEIAAHFGISQQSLSHGMSRSPANIRGIRQRHRMHLKRIRLTRY